ncbi:alpha/beta hydrolase [Algoriphagus marinus]|uniref:poly(ethylene terephthalate) hydrolase family protein n=1 Tax=Algoriphagus marinus TaxID=1925762 RepID=UPI00094BB139|nr:DMT family transporter [Algoriphagus marinus]
MKKFFKKIGTWIKGKLNLIKPGPFAIKGAAIGLLILTLIVFVIEVVGMSVNWKDPWILAFGLLILLAVTLVSYLAVKLIKLIYEIPRFYKRVLIACIILLSLVRLGDERFAVFMILVFSLIGAGIAMFWKGHFQRLTTPKKVVSVLGFVVGIAGIGCLIYFGSIRGLEIDEQINAAQLTENKISQIEVASPAENGNFQFTTFTYGSGKDLRREEFAEGVTYQTESVDGRAFIDNWKKFGGWWREKYWGFDAKELPLNARVWMPEGKGPFPLVLVVHGNHSMQDFSDPGYDYLGEFLASKGMILASVDENFINGSWTDLFGRLEKENDARGWLLLEHLRIWDEWNKNESHPLFGKADMDKIALMGHSRGGEAVGHAAMLNALEYYPDDASIKLGYHFNIKGIVAIAPVDGQYKPGGSGTKFENVDYLTIHGAQDADVTSFAGAMQYERIKFTDSTYHFKSAVYISGANHGQFNTSWGDNDYGVTFKGILNRGQLMPVAEQEEVAKVYIGAFLEASLNNRSEFLPLFIDARKGKDWLPESIYLSQFEDSNTSIWANFDEDFELTSTSTGGVADGENLSVWREAEIDLEYAKKGSRAVFLGWNYKKLNEGIDTLWKDVAKPTIPDSVLASYSITLDSMSFRPDSTSVLMFSLAESTESSNPKSEGKWVNNQDNTNSKKANAELENESDSKGENGEEEVDEEEDEKKPDAPLDFTIILTDQSGAEISFLLSEFSHLQRQIKSRVLKLDFLDKKDHSENIFQTFVFDLENLKSKNPAFTPALLQEIRFEFDQNESGVIILDQLGITKRINLVNQ